MPQNISINFLLFALAIFGLVKIASSPLRAATMPLANIAVGQVITVNGMKFAKTTTDGKFTAICESGGGCSGDPYCAACSTRELNVCVQCDSDYHLADGVCVACADGTVAIDNKCVTLLAPNAKNGTNMQDFQSNDCARFATPTASGNIAGTAAGNVTAAGLTGYTLVGKLKDTRDGKSYEVRKFADGKCWMVDNLMYGGASDACSAKSAFSGNGSSAATNRFGTGTYGDCRDPRVGGKSPCASGSTVCGYYYDWQAAIQDPLAYYGNPFQSQEPTQGICPDGWHLPIGDYLLGDYQTLYSLASAPSFWTGGNWKGVLSGLYDSSRGVLGQGSEGYYWSSTQYDEFYTESLLIMSDWVNHRNATSEKGYGHVIRCIKD